MSNDVRGMFVPDHYTVHIKPRAGDAIRSVIERLLDEQWFGLNELEEESLEALAESLEPSSD